MEQFLDTLVQLFVIVGHPQEEAEEYATAMFDRIAEVALTTLIAGSSKREEILEAMKKSSSPSDALMTIFSTLDDVHEIQAAFAGASSDVMGLYFQEVKPTLTVEQQNRISELLSPGT